MTEVEELKKEIEALKSRLREKQENQKRGMVEKSLGI